MSDLNIADALLEIQDGEFEIEYDIHVSTLSANEIHDHLNGGYMRADRAITGLGIAPS